MRPQPLSATYNFAENRGAMMSRRRKRRSVTSAAILLVICLYLIAVGVRGDMVDCKTKVLVAWHRHCATEGIRGKRAALRPRGPNPDAAGNPSARFEQPVSGDDLSAGILSSGDIDELVTELYGRHQRATQSKEQFSNMLNSLAASCCTDSMHDRCMIDASNLITCP